MNDPLSAKVEIGTGRDIGEQVRLWVGSAELFNLTPQALGNRLLDAAGPSRRLHGPLQDLARQPLFMQLLKEQQPAKARATQQALTSELAEIYNPAILTELVQLLEAATGTTGVSSSSARRPSSFDEESDQTACRLISRLWRLARTLRPLAPGLALGLGSSLALAWLGSELERVLFEYLGWGAGPVLLLALSTTQLLTCSWLRPWRTVALLDRAGAVDPQRAWRWVTAPWLHVSDREALLNVVVLAVLLGTTALPLREVILRYSLTSLGCLVLALWSSRWCHIRRLWGGASGVVASLLSLDFTLSLLRWQEEIFEIGPLRIPVWVLLWTWITVQITWTIPRRYGDDLTKPWQRVISSNWFWGLVLGGMWGAAVWLQGGLTQ